MFLHIYDTQVYNPSQYNRYASFIQAMNQIDEDYHFSDLNETGLDSKLFPLLNARYILLDKTIPKYRSDVVALMQGRKIVYSDDLVDVLESVNDQPTAAWIVHDVRTAPTASVLAMMNATDFEPHSTAIVETSVDGIQPAVAGANESAIVTDHEPETIRITATAASAGLLVMSEVYEPDWHAYVDGKKVDILPTDYAFRGVPIAAGTHVVELRYEPASLKYGLWLTIGAMLAWLTIALWQCWGRIPQIRDWVRPGEDGIPIGDHVVASRSVHATAERGEALPPGA